MMLAENVIPMQFARKENVTVKKDMLAMEKPARKVSPGCFISYFISLFIHLFIYFIYLFYFLFYFISCPSNSSVLKICQSSFRLIDLLAILKGSGWRDIFMHVYSKCLIELRYSLYLASLRKNPQVTLVSLCRIIVAVVASLRALFPWICKTAKMSIGDEILSPCRQLVRMWLIGRRFLLL